MDVWCYTAVGNRFGVTNFLFFFGFYRSTPSPLALFFLVDRFGPKRTLIIVNTEQVYLGTGFLTRFFVLDWFRGNTTRAELYPPPIVQSNSKNNWQRKIKTSQTNECTREFSYVFDFSFPFCFYDIPLFVSFRSDRGMYSYHHITRVLVMGGWWVVSEWVE